MLYKEKIEQARRLGRQGKAVASLNEMVQGGLTEKVRGRTFQAKGNRASVLR